jgi:hypothetical protein
MGGLEGGGLHIHLYVPAEGELAGELRQIQSRWDKFQAQGETSLPVNMGSPNGQACPSDGVSMPMVRIEPGKSRSIFLNPTFSLRFRKNS